MPRPTGSIWGQRIWSRPLWARPNRKLPVQPQSKVRVSFDAKPPVIASQPDLTPEPEHHSSDPLAVAPEDHAGMDHSRSPANDRRKLSVLMLGALGVVFGDIGTSPLYALKATVLATEGGLPNHIAVMGSLSMIFWALILVVTVKYVLIIMRADNDGEGGTLALAALAHRSPGMTRKTKAASARVPPSPL